MHRLHHNTVHTNWIITETEFSWSSMCAVNSDVSSFFYFVCGGVFVFVFVFFLGGGSVFFFFFCFLFFWLSHAACGILVPQPATEQRPSALRAWSPNQWTTWEFPFYMFLIFIIIHYIDSWPQIDWDLLYNLGILWPVDLLQQQHLGVF